MGYRRWLISSERPGSALADGDLLGRRTRLRPDCLHCLHHILSVANTSEHDVAPIEPTGIGSGDKELAAIGSGAGVCHRQAKRLVLEFEVFVLEF